MKNEDIKALVSLLDDTDEEVFRHIQNQLLSLGKDVIPALEDAWSHSFDPLLQQRIEHIVHKIQFDSLANEIKLWKENHSADLLAGTILIARYQYPDLDEDKIRTTLNQIKRDAWIEMNDHLTALEQVNILNRVFFDIYSFSGNTTNFHAPTNSFINCVLESKKGNPLLLSIVYSYIAQQLDIPIVGINLPEHFILCYQDKVFSEHYEYTYPAARILFYINAFSRGNIFGKAEIDQFLKKLDLKPASFFYEPCTNAEIITRLIRNLTHAYQKLGDMEKVEELNVLMEIFN